MRTVIFATAIRILTPLFLLFSLYILFRGHNNPGGGFIGGLIGSIAFIFHTLARGPKDTVDTFLSLTLRIADRMPGQSRPAYLSQMLKANLVGRKKELPDQWRQHSLRLRPLFLIALGLLIAVSSGTFSFFRGEPYMTAWWPDTHLPVLASLGTPLLFDTGIYLLVLGMVLKMVFTMSRD
ncbi:multicomponent Na+:H+ antiporter subunit B [Pontibacter ummariensis]|uniref:Multicomponent Na+:H+ antiporter subunit B n=1 Tax=Pontibacter ummariensis TaxID=1610492 RepID=A0A239BWY1_9BACT|nr:MnhB domain-containing protein [Pontibacter ummariensis]PRY15594.1 multicomponent Na+:H+ antiporter subunit B [Pontibacter ummariensis]SNS11941.1 multicomponent Na+:H+ antiporter subunit B [Pontibacter ummariensis]